MEPITQNLLTRLFYYNENTGIFTRLTSISVRHKIGDIAGGMDSKGYRQIRINGAKHLAHRLAWLYVYGEYPNGHIDHINHIRDDNRITNLRIVNRTENGKNLSKSKRNTSGTTGVHFCNKTNKWIAQIRLSKSHKYLPFEEKQDAVNQRLVWNKELEFHTNHGK